MQRSRSGPDGFDGWSTGGIPGERPTWAKTHTSQGHSNGGGAPFVTTTESGGYVIDDASRRPAPVYPVGKTQKVSLNQTSPAALASSRKRSPTRSARDPPSKCG